ncbi:MAG: hypothetical protein M5U09_01480 [Gammaproteobacteria bacterium]|nr:hypothetical protein [Gammaproteobacteria bacterium]
MSGMVALDKIDKDDLHSLGIEDAPDECKATAFNIHEDAQYNVLAQALGVQPANSFFRHLWIRPDAPGKPLGGVVEEYSIDTPSGESDVDPGRRRSGVLYNFAFESPGPIAILQRDECEEVREAIDGLATRVLEEMKAIRDAVPFTRWMLKAINGWIQFAIVVLGFWGAFRLIARRNIRQAWWDTDKADGVLGVHKRLGDAQTDALDDLEHASRPLDRWILDTIPLAGFLGDRLRHDRRHGQSRCSRGRPARGRTRCRDEQHYLCAFDRILYHATWHRRRNSAVAGPDPVLR